jgi:5-methylcytosine-specific restriction endonuclease McrA
MAKTIFENKGLEYLTHVVNKSTSFAEILRYYEYSCSSDAYRLLKRVLIRNNIDFSHIPTGLHSNLNRKFITNRVNIDDYFVENSIRKTKDLKRIILRENLKVYECQKCKNSGEWQDEKLSLQLDHINGINTDNRLENLRFLCPNCHSQTETYCGKSKRKRCPDCDKKINSKSTRCRNCSSKKQNKPNKKFFITKEELEKIIWEKPAAEIARIYNVSDKAVEKRCKILGIEKPGRGYWMKNR